MIVPIIRYLQNLGSKINKFIDILINNYNSLYSTRHDYHKDYEINEIYKNHCAFFIKYSIAISFCPYICHKAFNILDYQPLEKGYFSAKFCS